MDEVPKYRKRSKGCGTKKSKHKHRYENCVYRYSFWRPDQLLNQEHRWHFSIGTYCPLCGKIGTIRDSSWCQRTPAHWPTEWQPRAYKEFEEVTRTLPFFVLEDVFKCKYVDIGREYLEDY